MAISAIPVGFMAGLFGIGGGLITVPVLFYIFNSVGLDENFIMHLAVGTSFAIIIPTSIMSVSTHMKYKAVNLGIVKSYGAFVALGVLIGTIFASNLKTSQLILFFSIVTLILSFNFLIPRVLFAIVVVIVVIVVGVAHLAAVGCNCITHCSERASLAWLRLWFWF